MKIYFYKSFFLFFTLIFGFHLLNGQISAKNPDQNSSKTINIIFFNPEINPDVKEIKSATYDSYFSAVTERFSHFRNNRMLRVETPISYNNVDLEIVKEIILNNDAHYAVVPKVKFFKVGIGNYVFSSQVVVCMKLFDAKGNLITESNYDTLKKNARMFGSAENSIKIGTEGALRNIVKDLRKLNRFQTEGF